MGKRTSHVRRPRNLYETPSSAVTPLLRFLNRRMIVWEPTAGHGALMRALEPHVGVVFGTDIEPHGPGIAQGDMTESKPWFPGTTHIIGNPPWPSVGSKGEPVVGFVNRWASIYPMWLLLAADFAHNEYFIDLPCTDIASIGRVSWMGNDVSGFDNAAWYRFHQTNKPTPITFHRRNRNVK